MTPILATATAMLERPETPDDVRDVMEMIRRNVALEVGLIDDLLDLARIPEGQAPPQARGRGCARADLSRRRDLPARSPPAALSIVLDLAARRAAM